MNVPSFCPPPSPKGKKKTQKHNQAKRTARAIMTDDSESSSRRDRKKFRHKVHNKLDHVSVKTVPGPSQKGKYCHDATGPESKQGRETFELDSLKKMVNSNLNQVKGLFLFEDKPEGLELLCIRIPRRQALSLKSQHAKFRAVIEKALETKPDVKRGSANGGTQVCPQRAFLNLEQLFTHTFAFLS
jgi:hypothetical protein